MPGLILRRLLAGASTGAAFTAFAFTSVGAALAADFEVAFTFVTLAFGFVTFFTGADSVARTRVTFEVLEAADFALLAFFFPAMSPHLSLNQIK